MIGDVLRVNDLIAYQKGAVVSRTIIDEDSGTVTLFAFDNDQGLSEHTAPFDALVFVLEGSAEITIEGRKLGLKSGEMVIMPAQKQHALKALEKLKILLIMIRT